MSHKKLIPATITEFRLNLSQIIKAVRSKNIEVVVECRNEPICVLIKYDDYVKYKDLIT